MSTNPFARTPQSAGANTSKFSESAPPGQFRLPSRLSDDGTKKIPFGRLFGVELRKLYDTRAGKWLLGSTVLISAIILVLECTGDDAKQPVFNHFLMATMLGLRFILPVVGILTVTSEWSQRTGLVTFSLEPRRGRVILAKWAAALLVTFFVVAITMGLAVLAASFMAHHYHTSVDWNYGPARIAKYFLIWFAMTSMGIAFGLVLQNTPAAICGFLILPILYSIVTNAAHFLVKFGEWTDPNDTLGNLVTDPVPSNAWPKAAVAMALWLVVPMALGFRRLTTGELKSS